MLELKKYSTHFKVMWLPEVISELLLFLGILSVHTSFLYAQPLGRLWNFLENAKPAGNLGKATPCINFMNGLFLSQYRLWAELQGNVRTDSF